MTDKTNESLDQLKQIEDKKQKALMAKALKLLKDQAKLVLKAKYATNEILRQLNINQTDQKAIIDRVNNLADVKLNDDDEIDIESEVKEKLSDKKRQVESEVEKYPNYFNTSNTNTAYAFDLVDRSHTGAGLPSMPYQVTCLTAGDTLNVSADQVLTLSNGTQYTNIEQ